MLDEDQLFQWLQERHTYDLLRVEVQRGYDADDVDFRRFLDGAPTPDIEARSGWLQFLRDSTAAHRCWRKVHVVDRDVLATEGLNDHERHEFEWGFSLTGSAGERVRIAEAHLPVRALPDWYVVDDEHVLLMHFDGGAFVGAEPASTQAAKAYRALALAYWDAGTEFADWWASHPQFHRVTPRVA